MSEFKTPRLERGESIVGSVIHDEARGVQVAKVLTPSAIDLNERVQVVKRFDREGAELPEGEPVAKAWSDEARAAAAEARRGHAGAVSSALEREGSNAHSHNVDSGGDHSLRHIHESFKPVVASALRHRGFKQTKSGASGSVFHHPDGTKAWLSRYSGPGVGGFNHKLEVSSAEPNDAPPSKDK